MNTEKSLKLRRIGPFTFNVVTLELRQADKTVPLRPRAARLLAVLLEHEGEIVAHETLRQALWNGRTVEWQDGLHQAVRDVRTALGDTKPPTFIENIPRRGYRLRHVEARQALRTGRSFSQRVRYFGLGLVTFPTMILIACAVAVA